MSDLNNITLNGDATKQNIYFITGENGTGKSRLLEKIIDKLKKGKGISSYNNIIAFSGTFFDRLPVRDFIVKKNNGKLKYIYFGVKTNSNLVSRLTPIKKFISEIINFHKLSQENKDQEKVVKLILSTASKMLHKIGFDSRIHIEINIIAETGGFTKSGKRQTKSIDKEYLDFSLSEFSDENVSNLIDIFQLEDNYKLDDSKKIIENIAFYKINNNEKIYFQLGKSKDRHMLSSGEILYITMILGLGWGLCQTGKSLIVYDEPENSMHPEWQNSIIPMMINFIDVIKKECNSIILPDILVATHSPIIASSMKSDDKRRVLTLSLPNDLNDGFKETQYFGNDTGYVLKDLFNSLDRSKIFVEHLQKCINHFANNELEDARNELNNIQDTHLNENDPLKSVFDMLKLELLSSN